MPTLRHTLKQATQDLAPISDSPCLDAELLLGHALQLTRTQLITRLDDDTLDLQAFVPLLARRLHSEPVAYILGEWEFFSIPLAIRPPTLIPRPETEHLVEAALECLPQPNAHILDIGTGSGCIPIALALNAPQCTFIATDIKPHNLGLAQENIERHGLSERIEVREGSLFDPITPDTPKFHLICSNPPYIPSTDRPTLSRDIQDYEDPDALFSGEDGLDLIRTLIDEAPNYLHPGGYLLLEIGHDQSGAVTQLLEQHHYNDIGFKHDLADIPRIAIAKRPL